MVTVLKANGEKEAFSEAKLLSSIKRAGIAPEFHQAALAHVQERLYENIPTAEIYRHMMEFLDKTPSRYIKTKYRLKQAIMALGPTGYPFEDYVARLLQTQGYKTQVRSILQGRCVSHEIDVIAEKGSEKFMVEVKFHNGAGITTDVHVSLYTKARFDDLKERYNFSKGLLVTNTKATSDALAYAQCVEMDVISWSYPEGKALRDIVEKEKMYPITALTTLSAAQQQLILEKGIVLCKDLFQHFEVLSELDIPKDKEESIREETTFLANYTHDN